MYKDPYSAQRVRRFREMEQQKRRDAIRAAELERRRRHQHAKELERRGLVTHQRRPEEERMQQESRCSFYPDHRTRYQPSQSNSLHGKGGSLFRGQDGKLYRLVPTPSQRQQKECPLENNVKRGVDMVAERDESKKESKLSKAQQECNDLGAGAIEDCRDDEPQQETYLVEDVPVEEDDELKELKSVWRNRRPSPGLLMEPVEALARN